MWTFFYGHSNTLECAYCGLDFQGWSYRVCPKCRDEVQRRAKEDLSDAEFAWTLPTQEAHP